MTVHTSIEPTEDNGWASWHCPDCDTPCASDNPCDHCAEEDGYMGND